MLFHSAFFDYEFQPNTPWICICRKPNLVKEGIKIKICCYKRAINYAIFHSSFWHQLCKKHLPNQFIYDKTKKQFKRIQSKKKSTIEKHFSNTHACLKLIEEIIFSYVEPAWRPSSFVNYQCFFRSNDRSCYQNAEREAHQNFQSTS